MKIKDYKKQLRCNVHQKELYRKTDWTDFDEPKSYHFYINESTDSLLMSKSVQVGWFIMHC